MEKGVLGQEIGLGLRPGAALPGAVTEVGEDGVGQVPGAFGRLEVQRIGG